MSQKRKPTRTPLMRSLSMTNHIVRVFYGELPEPLEWPEREACEILLKHSSLCEQHAELLTALEGMYKQFCQSWENMDEATAVTEAYKAIARVKGVAP